MRLLSAPGSTIAPASLWLCFLRQTSTTFNHTYTRGGPYLVPDNQLLDTLIWLFDPAAYDPSRD